MWPDQCLDGVRVGLKSMDSTSLRMRLDLEVGTQWDQTMVFVGLGNHGDAGLKTMMLRVSIGDGVASLLAFCMMFFRLSNLCP